MNFKHAVPLTKGDDGGLPADVANSHRFHLIIVGCILMRLPGDRNNPHFANQSPERKRYAPSPPIGFSSTMRLHHVAHQQCEINRETRVRNGKCCWTRAVLR